MIAKLKGHEVLIDKYKDQTQNPLYARNPKFGTLANYGYPDEMQQNATFHQGLHFLLR